MLLSTAQAGSWFSFDTYDGRRFNNLKLLTILDSGTMLALGQDPNAMHHQMYPYLPSDTPDDFNAYMYAKFSDANNTGFTYVGLPWIRESSLVQSEGTAYVAKFTSLNAQQLNSLRSMFISAGIEDFVIEKV